MPTAENPIMFTFSSDGVEGRVKVAATCLEDAVAAFDSVVGNPVGGPRVFEPRLCSSEPGPAGPPTRPPFFENTKVKGADPSSPFWARRGVVKAVLPARADGTEITGLPKGFSPAAWIVKADFGDGEVSIPWKRGLLVPVQRKYADIEHLRERDEVLGFVGAEGAEVIRKGNAGAFAPGDPVQITTKIDGANASVAWDEASGRLEAFSREKLLDEKDGLRGFYEYAAEKISPAFSEAVADEDAEGISFLKNLTVFGEWCQPHTVKYDEGVYGRWIVYDAFDGATCSWLGRDEVKELCARLGFEHVEVLYEGPFVSWDHCRSFLRSSKAYGPDQEGIVVKRGEPSPSGPNMLKIVNESFRESHRPRPKKERTPAEMAEEARIRELAASVATKARTAKIILKFVDGGQLPAVLGPKDLGAAMKLVPKAVYQDAAKEEPEIVEAIGKQAGKAIASEAAARLREIVLGC